MLAVGLLGCGRLGREVMLPWLLACDAIALRVVAEPHPDADLHAALSGRTTVVADWESALDHSGLDAVVVTLPTSLHATAALAALSRGLAMYLEKPMAATLGDARAVHSAWRNAGSTVGVGFNTRFHPLARRMREWVETGRIGQPRVIRMAFSIAATPQSWRRHDGDGGGVLRDLASHHADLARFLLGREFIRVRATRTVSGAVETVAATAELEEGVVLSATWASGTVDEDVIEITGSDGAVRWSRYEDLTITERGRGVPGAIARLSQRLPTPGALRLALWKRRSAWNDPSFALALDNFVHAARSRAPVVPGPDEGLRSAAVVAALEESACSGNAVEVER